MNVLELSKEKVSELEKSIIARSEQIKDLSRILSVIQEQLFLQKMYLLQIQEIYRLAQFHFSRLRKEPVGFKLTNTDVIELDKWIGRAKSNDGIQDIIDALKELEKYFPADINKNLYALVQKIISGGAYKKKSK